MIKTQSIPRPDNVHVVKHEDGDTWDIVKVILGADARLGKYMCEFASQFEVSYAGLYDLWYWVHKNIKYIADKPGHEKVKDPRVTWKDGYGDCKSFSLFIASVLRCLGIRYKYRFASYDKKDKHPTHVYVVASLDRREIILDAVHNKFDDEADYQNKWDKMPTRISYLHGTSAPAVQSVKARPSRNERIADAPQKSIVLPDLKISNLTGGQTTLELLDRQLQILIGYYGDPDGILQKARNIIYQAKRGHFHYNNTLPTGYVDPRLNDLLRQIKEASTNTRINGTNHHIGELEYKRPASYPKNCKELKETTEYKQLMREYRDLGSIPIDKFNQPGREWTKEERARFTELYKYIQAVEADVNNCTLSHEFTDLLTTRIDKSAHHMLYEFVQDANSQPNVVSTKTTLHKVAISSLGQLAYIDRNNIRIMTENGIMSTNSKIKDFGDITPANAIAILREAHKYEVPEARIGELLTLITGLIIAIGGAIAAAASFQQQMNEKKRIDFQSKVNGFGTQEFSPDPLDFLEDNTNKKEVGFSFKKILPYALLGGSALIFLPQLMKK